jgi:hypothetical protein
MTTLPQVARALREMLTTTAAEAGRATRFVQRPAPLHGATCSQTLVFGLLGNPQATLAALTHTAAAWGIEISPQALEQRLTASAAAGLPQGLLPAIARVSTAEPVALPLLARFTAVYGQDRSTMILPEVCAAQWPGGGGRTSSSASAALKLQARVARRPGRLDGQLQEGRAAARAAALPGPRPAGALRLADVGSWSLEACAALAPHQVCWLARLQRQTAVYDATGARQDLLTLWESPPTDTVARAVALGERQPLAARLVAVRVPQDVADTRRRRLRKAARDQGRQGRAPRRARAAWPLCVPHGPAERLTWREALGLGRMRWQMELRFTLWTSHGRVDESRSPQPWRILGEGYAKLLAMLVQHGVFLVRLWASPERSLANAAQTVQTHARHLARACPSVQRLGQALLTVKRCLAAGWRMNRRKKPPNT